MNFTNLFKKVSLILGCFLLVFSFNLHTANAQPDIGVIFALHGGMNTYHPQYLWDASVHMFSYDPNHPVYKIVIWNSSWWGAVLLDPSGIKFIRKYAVEYERIRGTDPFHSLSDQQLADMETELDSNPYGLDFEVDWVGWMAGNHPDHYAYPRFIYYGPDGPGVGDNITYCGESETEVVVLGFDTGTSEFNVAATLTGQISGATALIDEVTVNSGSWVGGDAAGFLSLSIVSGSFEDDEIIVDDGTIPGSAIADGTTHWEGCDPNRYDVDGPVERLLKKGVSSIIMVDLTVGGVRFYKAYDPFQMTKKRLDEWNSEHETSIPIIWVNDYSNLMERSYPTEPEGWTPILGDPTYDPKVLLNGNPNPIASDPELALLHVEGIEASMSDTVSDAETGVILFNHGLFFDEGGFFDPKIDDTIILNKNIKSKLLELHPTMDPDNIVGAYWGVKELNPVNGLVELNREQRGENLGGAHLYESELEMPGDEWGYRCWAALEYLKDRGVKHIVIGFPQVITDSVLTYVELPNQIAKEIGMKTWAKWGTWDYVTYPGVGHPFLDYWGPWVDTDCGEWDLNYDNGTSEFTAGEMLTGQTSGATGVIKWFSGDVAAGTLTLKGIEGTFQDNEVITDDKGGSALADGSAIMTSKSECCFEMGGCGDPLRPYPPPRQTPINTARKDMDPSLAYDLSDYGHLGYDPGMGAPDPNQPVQDQYTGTWEMYVCPSDDPAVGQLLAKHVLNAAVNPMVYITNGNLEGIEMGGSVTFEAHVTGGVPGYTYEWSIKEEGGPDWSSVGGNSSTWLWNPGKEDVGTYAVRCSVTDSQAHTGEVIWEGFIILEKQPCLSEEIYGEDSEEAEILRYMRDNILSHTPEGQELIRLYYEWSPAIVKVMFEDEEFKEKIKEMIDGILPMIKELVE